MIKKKKIYLVGAGPSDVGLLTLRAKQVIKKADVVLYDYLVSKDVLKLIKPGVEKVCFAKNNKKDFRLQKKISNFFVNKYLAGKIVVRLKGGDPFLFSRGIEELEELAKKGIPYEVVPGITSGLAACVYSRIPITRRGMVSSVVLVTGSEAKNKKSNINWVSLAQSNATLIFYMAVARLSKIVSNLVKNGLDKDTPCALIENATSIKERLVQGKLISIRRLAVRQKIESPAIFVVSKTIALRERLIPGKAELENKKIVVTRERPAYLGELFKKEKAEIIHFPTIKTVALDYDIKDIEKYNWVVFLSINAVRRFRNKLKKLTKKVKIACIGEKTKECLLQMGYKVDLVPKEFTSEGLVKALRKKKLKHKQVLVVRSRKGNDCLKRGLGRYVAGLKELYVYDIVLDCPDKTKFFKAISKGIDVLTFLSAQSAGNFVTILGRKKAKELSRQSLVASIGPATSARLRSLGIRVDFTSNIYTIDNFVKGLKQKIKEQW